MFYLAGSGASAHTKWEIRVTPRLLTPLCIRHLPFRMDVIALRVFGIRCGVPKAYPTLLYPLVTPWSSHVLPTLLCSVMHAFSSAECRFSCIAFPLFRFGQTAFYCWIFPFRIFKCTPPNSHWSCESST